MEKAGKRRKDHCYPLVRQQGALFVASGGVSNSWSWKTVLATGGHILVIAKRVPEEPADADLTGRLCVNASQHISQHQDPAASFAPSHWKVRVR